MCRVTVILALVVLITATSLVACWSVPLLQLTSIPRDQIPQPVLDIGDSFIPEGKTLADIGLVWRACERNGDRLLVACTFFRMGDKNQPVLSVSSWPLDESGKVAAFDEHIVVMDFNDRVNRLVGARHGTAIAKDGSTTTQLSAGGLCRDTRVTKIVGTTSSGRSVQTTPVNGFWYLFIDGLATTEKWTKISGLDAKDKPIVDLTPSPQEGL